MVQEARPLAYTIAHPCLIPLIELTMPRRWQDRGTPECPGPECYCSNVTEPNVECAGEPAIFTVTVLDVQDTPPRFERLPYIAEVHENDTVVRYRYRPVNCRPIVVGSSCCSSS